MPYSLVNFGKSFPKRISICFIKKLGKAVLSFDIEKILPVFELS